MIYLTPTIGPGYKARKRAYGSFTIAYVSSVYYLCNLTFSPGPQGVEGEAFVFLNVAIVTLCV